MQLFFVFARNFTRLYVFFSTLNIWGNNSKCQYTHLIKLAKASKILCAETIFRNKAKNANHSGRGTTNETNNAMQ